MQPMPCSANYATVTGFSESGRKHTSSRDGPSGMIPVKKNRRSEQKARLLLVGGVNGFCMLGAAATHPGVTRVSRRIDQLDSKVISAFISSFASCA